MIANITILVFLFENTELKDLCRKKAKDIEGVYVKTGQKNLCMKRK
jgi:hypothetical protein